MRSKLLLATIMTIAITACTGPTPDTSQYHTIGKPLTAVTSMTNELGQDETKVALYDKTVDRIDVFDLTQPGAKPLSIEPVAPGGKHYELYEPNGNYVIDLCQKHMSIFNAQGAMMGDYSFVG